MDEMSPESRALYEILKSKTKEEYEARFLDYKKEILDAVKIFANDMGKQFKSVSESIESVHSTVETELAEVKTTLGAELETVKGQLSAEISQLAAAVDRVVRLSPSAGVGGSPRLHIWHLGDSTVGPSGHRCESQHRGTASANHTPPPVGGMNSGRNSLSMLNLGCNSSANDNSASAPRVELPQFEGSNPKLWQRLYEEYVQRWGTLPCHWVSYGSSQFTGVAVTWLESFLTKFPQAAWSEFVQAVQARFMRNQHQVLLRRMFHICQTGTLKDYVQRFSDLVDLILAYESQPDPLHYLTRFLNGLKTAVRVLVAIQQPGDLDAPYTMALLYEELGDGSNPLNSQPSYSPFPRRVQALPTPPPQPPAKWISKTVEEKRQSEAGRTGAEDKWSSLKVYHRALGLCFVCGEKWGRDHQCKNAIQLHVVQEMINCMQAEDSEQSEEDSNSDQ